MVAAGRYNNTMRVLVTGIGARCSLGDDVDSLWDGIARGNSGISPITRFDVVPFDVKVGAMVPSSHPRNTEEQRLLEYGHAAAAEALGHARISDECNVVVVLGTCNGVLGSELHGTGTQLLRSLHLRGPVIVVSTACASSAHAVGLGADLVRRGYADIALAGGVDTLCQEVFAGFHAMGLLSKGPCAPFSTAMGTTLGEGAAFMVLESEPSVERRAATAIVEFKGHGMSSDAFHDTTPDPSGAGIARALDSALADAGLPPEAIDYYNAHGTGTAFNDGAEWRALKRVFGDAANCIPVSSSKSFLGHTQGAAGALEAVVTLKSMAEEVVPPTIGVQKRRRESPTDPVIGTRPRAHVTRHAVCGSAGFGGFNGALVFGERGHGRLSHTAEVPRPISIAGIGVAPGHLTIDQLVPQAALRGTDKSARLLAGAVGSAVKDGGFRFRAPDCARMGVFVGQPKASPGSVEAFRKSIRDRGVANLSTSEFKHVLCSYALGACCKLLGLKGPSLTLSTGSSSGIAALVLAADHLMWRNDVDHMLAAAVNESTTAEDHLTEAASVLLGTGRATSSILLRDWALEVDSDMAARRVLERVPQPEKNILRWAVPLDDPVFGLGTVVELIDSMRKSPSGPVLVVGESECAGVALILDHGRSA